jgi:hypothetical protein
VLRGMTGNSARVVTTKRMEAIFRREEIVYAVECKISTWLDEKGKVHYTLEIKRILDKHQKVFGPIPPSVPPDKGFEHIIELEAGAKPVITTPYRHPKKYKDHQGAPRHGTHQTKFKPICFISSLGEEEGWNDENVH